MKEKKRKFKRKQKKDYKKKKRTPRRIKKDWEKRVIVFILGIKFRHR